MLAGPQPCRLDQTHQFLLCLPNAPVAEKLELGRGSLGGSSGPSIHGQVPLRGESWALGMGTAARLRISGTKTPIWISTTPKAQYRNDQSEELEPRCPQHVCVCVCVRGAEA